LALGLSEPHSREPLHRSSPQWDAPRSRSTTQPFPLWATRPKTLSLGGTAPLGGQFGDCLLGWNPTTPSKLFRPGPGRRRTPEMAGRWETRVLGGWRQGASTPPGGGPPPFPATNPGPPPAESCRRWSIMLFSPFDQTKIGRFLAQATIHPISRVQAFLGTYFVFDRAIRLFRMNSRPSGGAASGLAIRALGRKAPRGLSLADRPTPRHQGEDPTHQ